MDEQTSMKRRKKLNCEDVVHVFRTTETTLCMICFILIKLTRIKMKMISRGLRMKMTLNDMNRKVQ